jgi:DNA-binding response OmpR family regulator
MTDNLPKKDFPVTTPVMGIDLDEVEVEDRWRVLIVDDDQDTVFLLKQILRLAGFDVLGAVSGEEALKKINKESPDIVLLDIMMPEMDGWDTFAQIREMTEVPVIAITALTMNEDVVKGLRHGMDDYIIKPFYNPEVVERVKTVLRRAGKHHEVNRLEFPQVGLVLDMKSQEVTLKGVEVRMTQKEFNLLALLAKNNPAIVTYDSIAEVLWGQGADNIRKRTNYLSYLLRKKFTKIDPGVELIINVDRVGYRLNTLD